MHSASRLRPPGEAVCRIVIHLSSVIFLITLSFPQSWSITITARSVEEWPGLLKWAATGLSMFLRFMSERWLFRVSFSAAPFRQHIAGRTTCIGSGILHPLICRWLPIVGCMSCPCSGWRICLSSLGLGRSYTVIIYRGCYPGGWGVGCTRCKVCLHQQVSQVLWPTVCDDGRLGEGLFGSLRQVEDVVVLSSDFAEEG